MPLRLVELCVSPTQKIHLLGEQRLASIHGSLREKTGRLPEPLCAVQIDTTLRRLKSSALRGFQRFTLSFNRTAVLKNNPSGLSLLPIIGMDVCTAYRR